MRWISFLFSPLYCSSTKHYIILCVHITCGGLVTSLCIIGKEKLSLPLFIMGCLVTASGFTALRLPETLHQRLPQTLEEGEEFGKDWSMNDCMRCDPGEPSTGSTSGSSYEAFAREDDDVKIEMKNQRVKFRTTSSSSEKIPLESGSMKRFKRRQTMRKLNRQQSCMDTQKSGDLGAMQLTYWF